MTGLLATLRDRLPEGVPVPVRWLHAQGISSALVQRYVQSGWLEALPGRAYRRPGPPPTWPAALYGAQHTGWPVHVGHLSALGTYGLTHTPPLGRGAGLHLYLAGRPPAWLQALPDAVIWHREQLVTEHTPAWAVQPQTLRTPPSHPPVSHKLGVEPAPRLAWPVYVSTPERAALEVAAGLTRGDSWDTAYETFTGLTMLRPALVRDLLLACTRIVTRRLFLHLAQSSGQAWLKHVNLDGLDLGSGDRQVVPGGRLDPVWHVTVPREEAEHGF